MAVSNHAIHYAGWKRHIGLYPVAAVADPLEAEIAPYGSKKDSVSFPYSEAIPYELIERLAAELAAIRRAAAVQ